VASFKSAVSHASTVMLVFCTISNTLNRQSLEFHDNTTTCVACVDTAVWKPCYRVGKLCCNLCMLSFVVSKACCCAQLLVARVGQSLISNRTQCGILQAFFQPSFGCHFEE